MVGSAALKQGRSANRKHTYIFFCLTCMSFNTISKNKILTKISEFTVGPTYSLASNCIRMKICKAPT